MTTPGLHELECKQCGAPMTPPAESTVLPCTHCGQPHMWIAPSRGDNTGHWQIQARARPARPARLGKVLVGVALGVLGLMVLGVVTGFLLYRTAAAARTPVGISADMPLARGDSVTYHYAENSSCTSYIEAINPDGSVRMSSCPGGAASAPRDRLELRALHRTADGGDVVIHSGPRGWERLLVVGHLADDQLRVEPLQGGPARIVKADSVFVVRDNAAMQRWVAPPRQLAYEPGDVVRYRFGNEIRSGRVTVISGDGLELQPGFHGNHGFEAQTKPSVNVDKSRVLLELGTERPPVAGLTLVTEHTGTWRRAEFESEGEWCRWNVKAKGERWVTWCGQVLLLPRAAEPAKAVDASP